MWNLISPSALGQLEISKYVKNVSKKETINFIFGVSLLFDTGKNLLHFKKNRPGSNGGCKASES